jgi:hypothetical protein
MIKSVQNTNSETLMVALASADSDLKDVDLTVFDRLLQKPPTAQTVQQILFL